MSRDVPDLCTFLDSAPTSWHAAECVADMLTSAGYKELFLKERFSVKAGNSYFVRKGGALFTFTIPKKQIEKLLIFTTHTDSPGYMLKRHPDMFVNGSHLLNVEMYGGPLQKTWLDRDLFLAGRVFTSKNGKLKQHLVTLEEFPFTIPSLAIHLDRKQEAPQNRHMHLRPLFDMEESAKIETLLRKKCSGETVHSFELLCIPSEPARKLNGNLIASYRLDNLASVHATVTGLLEAEQPKDTLVCHALFDHEEIGSATAEGGMSSLFESLLTRIAHATSQTELVLHEWKAQGFGVSIDMAHAFHPNHPEKYDAQNSPLLGGGVSLKHNAQKRYATNAYTASYIEVVAKKHAIPIQHFTSHSDGSCGSTIGHFLSHLSGIDVVDLGIPQLAMHSARELIAEKDYESLKTLVKALV